MTPPPAVALAAPTSSDLQIRPGQSAALLAAAQALFIALSAGRKIDAGAMLGAMEEAFGGSDAEGLWSWKEAYEAVEAAQVLFLRQFGKSIACDRSPAGILSILERLGALLPTETRRSETSQALQQFSTPVELAFLAALAAGLSADDLVLEPSAGTGLLAVQAEISGAKLLLNEWAEDRHNLLKGLFPKVLVTRLDSAQIHDRLDPALRPSVVLMNPPFSASPLIVGRYAAATFEHPALLAAVRDASGDMRGIQRCWLAPDGRKTALDDPKRSLGHIHGHGAWLRHDDRETSSGMLLIGEGVETVLSLAAVLPSASLVAALSASHLAGFILPGWVTTLLIARDNDPAGIRAARKLASRAAENGINVSILRPVLKDFNADLRLLGRDVLAANLRRQWPEQLAA